jgi:hypothetical protein
MKLDKVKALYDSNIDQFGIDPRSVGWGTQEKIELRFKKLFSVIDEPNVPFTLNELGCGYGEAVHYCNKYKFNLSGYYGYDISDKMLAAAQQHLEACNNVHLANQASLSEVCDYSITSGIFNVKFDTGAQEWNEYILSILANLHAHSRKGFAFNMLTRYVDYESEGLNYGDPLFYFDHCKNNFSRHVSLLHDYNLYEFTIIVKKDELR